MLSKHHISIGLLLSILILLDVNSLSASMNAIIEGIVIDSETGEPLPGANVFIVGSSIGTATDSDGKYVILRLPPGFYKIRATYIGYEQQEKSIRVRLGQKVEVNFEMNHATVKGETVVVTAQAEGQLAAINQQRASYSIKNIVSAARIEELPEANAAEAVGRLPGISLQREGGEGNKVVIRGLAPKYNKIQIDGVDMTSTDSDDRSTDLSMISPYMLGGIEVTKSAMADQEADQLGGTINFKLKGAPYTKSSYQLIMEGGYNGLRNEYKDYKLVARTSRRLYNDLIGLSLNMDVEKRNRSSNTVSSEYDFDREERIAQVNSLFIEDITRDLNRYNASLLMDYKTTTTDITLSNMISRVNRTTVSRSENSSELRGAATRTQYLTYSETSTTILMNRLKIEQHFGNFKIDLGMSYSYAKDDMPEELGYGGLEQTPLSGPIPKDAKPADVPNYMLNDVTKILLSDFRDSNSFTREDEFDTHLNLAWDFRLSDQFKIKFQTGGKYKHKSREHDYDTIYLNTATDPSSLVNLAIVEKWPWMSEFAGTGSFPYHPFIDYDYNPGEFMNGEYFIERVPDLDMGIELIHYLEDYLGIEEGGTASAPQRFVPNFHTSKMSDYHGKDDYLAWYFMPTLSFGRKFTFIPGIRYEHNKTIYTGVRGDGSQKAPSHGYDYHETTVTRENEFFLPMIHARYLPLDWFDVRASYTQTLSRPSYREFLPSWNISGPPLSIEYSNPNLRPAKSENYDLYFSFYGNKIGLFTIGLFAKEIDDLIFSQSKIILSDSMAVEEFGLSEEETGRDPSTFEGKRIYSYLNNPNKVEVRGIELEWQSNFWYLPGLLKNIVFGINYTYTYSEATYPRTVPIKEIQPSPFGNREVIVGNADSSYAAPLLLQPDHILNLTLGFDYKGFSIRSSMQIKSDIFSQNDWRPQLRGYTDDFYLYDLSVSQKLPIHGLVLIGNIKNFTKTIETDINTGTGYMSNKEYYGRTANLSIKYTF